MRITQLDIPDLVRLDPEPLEDSRGFFIRLLCVDQLAQHGIEFNMVQCNNTLTRRRGSIRGLHFQRPPKDELKIVRCVSGAILDVAIDLRSQSPTFGRCCSSELSAENRAMMFIPAGFAHGFQTLTDDVELIYFHSQSYSAELEGGVNPLDPDIAGVWPLSATEMSDRDRQLPGLAEVEPIVL